jgi:hypothetical protein
MGVSVPPPPPRRPRAPQSHVFRSRPQDGLEHWRMTCSATAVVRTRRTHAAATEHEGGHNVIPKEYNESDQVQERNKIIVITNYILVNITDNSIGCHTTNNKKARGLREIIDKEKIIGMKKLHIKIPLEQV